MGGSDFYMSTMPFNDGICYPNLFSLQDSSYHASLKGHISPLYSKTHVHNFESQVDSCTRLLLAKLEELCRAGPHKVDVALWLHFYAFDSLAEMNLSKKLGFLETGEDVHGMMAAADTVLHMTGLV